jgi:P27 family predicted phage terminase small subunit
MRGRKPKATALHALEGTRPRSDRSGEVVAAGGIGPAPEHFSAAQSALWDYYASCAPEGLLKSVDRSVFTTFIISSDMVRQCSEILSAEGLLLEGERGVQEHPASRALARFSMVMVKAASDCGFSPAARPRIHVAPSEQANPFTAFASPTVDRKSH